MLTGFQSKDYNGEIPTIGEVPTMKMSSDKKETQPQAVDVNFKIAVALACLDDTGMNLISMHQLTHMELIAWEQSCSWIKFHLSM